MMLFASTRKPPKVVNRRVPLPRSFFRRAKPCPRLAAAELLMIPKPFQLPAFRPERSCDSREAKRASRCDAEEGWNKRLELARSRVAPGAIKRFLTYVVE